jgi:hypothetical protein
MANLLGTTVNGALSASGRISVTYNTDRYQFNFNRTSASNWWVTNDSTALGLHVDNVGDKFYFSTAGDFYSSTNGWLSTALAGKSNVGHTHDDRYYTETESDGRFQPLENQRLSTGNSPTFVDIYANEWFRNNNANEGLYNQATGTHFYSNGATSWAITGSGGNIQLEFRSNHQSTIRGYVYADTSNQIGFLSEDGNWVLKTWNRGVEAYGSMRAPIFYDSQDTTYYLDPNSTTALRTVGSWRSDSAAWDGEFAGKIQYHSNNWYFQASSNWFFRNSGGSNVVSIDSGGNISANGFVGNNSAQTRDKLRVWDGSSYSIGMKSGYDYGHLGTDEYAMSFQMNDNSGRGFWWGDDAHNDNQGAASLTTDGRMTIAKSLSVGEGEAVILPSSTPLYVKGSTSGADVIGVDGINGRLFTVTDDLSNSLFSVNTIAGLPVIEAFADNTVNIGKYGYATTWSTTGFVTVPNSANIYRDLFINGGRAGDFGNRLIIGTDATTYTMQDSNQRPTAYLHGAYPVLTLNHTVTSNGSHGPTIQFTHNTADKQWVIGTNGTGTRLDIGYSTNTNRNPHNGIDDNNGSTFLRVDNGGNIQLGRGNGRSTWVNDILYVGASDSGDSHMYFGEDSSNWYGLHWYWDSGYTVYLYGRNAGTDTEIMRYTTNSNTYVEWRRNFHMNNYEINYVSQLHFNAGTRFVGNTSSYLNFQTDSTTVGGIIVRDGNSSVRGYADYFDSSGFGLLNSTGNWGIRLNPGNVGTLLYYAGSSRLDTRSGGVGVQGNLYTDNDYGYGLVGVYASTRYQGVFAMSNDYKLLADGTGTGNLYGLAWTHTNVGGQSKAGLEHQLLVMNNGTTLTALGNGIWTNGLITTTSYGTSANWNTAFGWGNHASADYIVKGTQVLSAASWTTATRFGSVGDISQEAGNHALSVRSEAGNDAFMSFHIGSDYAVHFGLDDVTNRLHVGGWSDGAGNKYQIWDSRDFSSTNISNWNTAYGWGNHASAGYITGYTETDTLNSVTTRGASTTNNITLGGLTVSGSLSYGTYTTESNYVTGADNIVLKGNSTGVSGIFFESEKDGTNINHPSDFGFIQYHAYGIGGSSGEANRLVIGVSNDADDIIVLNPVNTNGLVVRVGAGTTEYTVYHSGNIPTWNQNTTGNAATATYATTAGSAPNAGNVNPFYNVTAGGGNGLRFWGGSDEYKISMGVGGLYQYGPVIDYSIKTQMDPGSTGRGFTWGNNGVTPVAALNATSGNMQIAGTFTASNFSGSSSGTNTGDQTNISGNAATATTASNLAADTSTRFKILTFTGVGGDSGNGAMPDSYAIYQQGGSWTHPYPDLCIGYHTGIKIGANSGYNGTRFYNDSNWATEIFSVGNGDNHVRVLNNLYVTGTVTGSNLSGTNTGDQINISGNAATATTAGALTSMNISQFTNNSGYITSSGSITGSAGSVAWDNVTSKPSWMINASLIGGHSDANSQVNSGFYENGGGGSNWPAGSATWYNSINVRHSNQGNYHGFQVAMSYYDNLLWFRSYQGSGTFQSWVYAISSANIGSQSVASAVNADTVDGFHASVAGTANTIPTRNANGYLIPENWIQLNGIYGLYSPTNNAHLRPNDGSYGSWLVTGSRNSWRGLEFDSGSNGNVSLMVNVSSNTTGFHNNSYGWQFYWEGGTLYCSKNAYGGGTNATVIDSTTIGSQSVAFATTANRLERYGVIYGNNWNDYYLNNRFIVASAHNATGTNKPDTAYNYGSMMSYYNSGEDHYQIYVTENSVNSNGKDRKMYYRSGWNGGWGGWRSVVDVYNSVCYIDAAVTATGDITAFSDGRVKENVETLEGALDKTLKLRGVSYNRTDIEDKSTKIGVIAQEILEVVPEVVSQDENGMYAVSYGNITALLIEAIKEQQKQINELKEIINGFTR